MEDPAVPHFTFTGIPEALDAIPSHTWLAPTKRREIDQVRTSDLWSALRRAEARVRELRALLDLNS
jgi:hypothetical protein